MVLVTSLLLVFSGCASALTPYTGTPPKLPSRQPFGFGSAATGGSTNTSAVYLVKNANELREAIALPYTKTIYVDGTIHGNQLSDVRNLKLVSPKDCFPAPETYPSSWNAKYDAMALVTATNVWVDGCELQDQLSGEYVTPDYMWPGWQVDRFDGLFDVEDGSDKVTFSHNIVRNHHKSLLFGGGEKEAERDLGKMRITLFANHFNQSASRNPLMRFGTFELVANLFTSQNHKSPLFNIENSSGSTQTGTCSTNIPAAHQYHLGVYNQSKVYLSSNTFKQTGCYANDQSRIFTITESTNSALPALVCVDESSFKSTLNQVVLDLKNVVTKTLTYAISAGKAVQNGVLLKCDGVVRSGTTLPKTFKTNDEVVTYVQQNAGQSKV
ncbi:hypothetical protein FRC02_010240 [Tulasnella sp. 418]|nr:hypothetical protein FRC02_010240 [Tulasnella sp. 418]